MPAAGQDTPRIWAHCVTDTYLAAFRDIQARLKDTVIHCPDFSFTIPPTILDDMAEAAHLDMKGISRSSPPFAGSAPLDLAIWAGGRLFPHAIGVCNRLRLPLALVDPNLEIALSRPWVWRKTSLSPALKQVDQMFLTSQEALNGWKSLGARPWNIQTSAPLSGGIVPPRCDDQERQHLSNLLSARPVWFAYQVPLDELDWVLAATRTAQRSWPRLVTLIEPARAEDTTAFKETFKDQGFITHDRSAEGEPSDLTQVFLTDPGEEAGLWCRLAGLTYLGGTASGAPCPNPAIPASLGSAVLAGPRQTRHKTLIGQMYKASALTQINHGVYLGEAVSTELAPDACAAKAFAAWELLSHGAETSDRLIQYIVKKLSLEMID